MALFQVLRSHCFAWFDNLAGMGPRAHKANAPPLSFVPRRTRQGDCEFNGRWGCQVYCVTQVVQEKGSLQKVILGSLAARRNGSFCTQRLGLGYKFLTVKPLRSILYVSLKEIITTTPQPCAWIGLCPETDGKRQQKQLYRSQETAIVLYNGFFKA